MMTRACRNCLAGCTDFKRSQDGSALLIVALSLAAMIGFLALTFDFGRLATTQSELQSFVDNVALSAAGELDGRGDAITRATAAADQMITSVKAFCCARGAMAPTGARDRLGLSTQAVAFLTISAPVPP